MGKTTNVEWGNQPSNVTDHTTVTNSILPRLVFSTTAEINTALGHREHHQHYWEGVLDKGNRIKGDAAEISS